MRRVLFLISIIAAMMSTPAEAASRIIKVLPHFLDLKGRHALSPSLYERDAYQAYLRNHPNDRSALRVNVQWKSDAPKSKDLKLRIELRGANSKSIQTKTLEQSAQKNGWFTNWTPIEFDGEEYKAFGELIAWRATLWDGDKQIAEQKSFLW
jgi:hypothetical protein